MRAFGTILNVQSVNFMWYGESAYFGCVINFIILYAAMIQLWSLIFFMAVFKHTTSIFRTIFAILFCICSSLQFDAMCLVSWKPFRYIFLFVLINWRFQLHSNYSIICWLLIQFCFSVFFLVCLFFYFIFLLLG